MKINKHEFSFMGNDTKGRGDLEYCALCNQWRWSDGLLFKMSTRKYLLMVNSNEVTGI